MYRVALIGCGGRGRAHLPAILADPRLQLVALADAKREAAEAIAPTTATVYEDYEDLLKKEKPDMVVIALWTELHLPVLKACIAAGVRIVHSEKPVAPTWGEYQAIAELAESSGIQLTFCHQRRYAEGNCGVRALLEAGRFGKIERMELYSPPHLLDCGTHSVDQALSFNRETPIKWAHGAVDLSSTVSFFNVPAEGMATGMFYFENGVLATIRCGRLDMDLWGGIRVTGSEGFVEVFWDGKIRRAVIYEEPTWCPPVFEESHEQQMLDMMRGILDDFEAKREPELSHRHALRAGEVLFALYASAQRHERVDLPLTGVTGNPLFEMLNERATYRQS